MISCTPPRPRRARLRQNSSQNAAVGELQVSPVHNIIKG